MKRFLSIFLFLCFFCCQYSIVFAKDSSMSASYTSAYLMAEKDNIPHNIKIKKKNGLYGVINPDTGEVLIPFNYYSIKPLGVDTVKAKKSWQWEILTNNNIPVMPSQKFYRVTIEAIDKNKPKDIANSIYIGIYEQNELKVRMFIPSNPAKDFFKKIYEKNNQLSWLKFNNYPNNGTLIFKLKDKYGYMTTDGEDYIVIFPYYDKVYIADSNSAMYRLFHISYLPLNQIFLYEKNNGWMNPKNDPFWFYTEDTFLFDVNVNEKLEIKNGEVHLTYVSESPFNKKFITSPFSGRYSLQSTDMISYTYGDGLSQDALMTFFQPDKNLKQIYDEVNAKSFIKIQNFPQNGLHLTKDNSNNYGLIIYDEKRGNKVIPNEYSQFYFQDSDNFMYKFLNMSFSNTDRIIAKKNNKWGIINSDNKVVADFKYDFITGMSAKNEYEINYDTAGIYINNKKITFPENNLFLVYKDNLCGVINENGETVIPLKELYSKENITKVLTAEEKTTLQNAMNNAQKIKNTKEKDFSAGGIAHGTLVFIHTSCILIPAWTVGAIFWPFILAYGDNPVVRFFFDEMQ